METSQYRLIIFDADGTLRRTLIPSQPCPNKPDEWALMPNVQAVLAHYIDAGVKIGLCSNQAGVAAGFLSDMMAGELLADLWSEVTRIPRPAGAVRWCPHAVDAGCACRKPSPLMLFEIMQSLGMTTLTEVLYVGDMESDQQTAIRAGVHFCWAKEFFRWE